MPSCPRPFQSFFGLDFHRGFWWLLEANMAPKASQDTSRRGEIVLPCWIFAYRSAALQAMMMMMSIMLRF